MTLKAATHGCRLLTICFLYELSDLTKINPVLIISKLMVTDTACGCYTPLSYCVTLLNYRQKNKFQSTIQNFK